jgi:TRAP-type C4-dicarboxylate transport system permease small subunit
MLNRIANYLNTVVTPVSRGIGVISMVVIVLVVLLVVVDVCLRRLFNAPIQGSHDLQSLGFSIIVFLPLAWCAIQGGHVELDLISRRLPKTAKLYLEVVMIFITTAILALMSWQLLVQGTKLQASNAETAILEIPMYPFIYLATFGSIMLALVFFIRFLRVLSNTLGGQR